MFGIEGTSAACRCGVGPGGVAPLQRRPSSHPLLRLAARTRAHELLCWHGLQDFGQQRSGGHLHGKRNTGQGKAEQRSAQARKGTDGLGLGQQCSSGPCSPPLACLLCQLLGLAPAAAAGAPHAAREGNEFEGPCTKGARGVEGGTDGCYWIQLLGGR